MADVAGNQWRLETGRLLLFGCLSRGISVVGRTLINQCPRMDFTHSMASQFVAASRLLRWPNGHTLAGRYINFVL